MAVSLCSINEDLNKDIRSFRFNRSTKARAMILKIDQNTKELKGMKFKKKMYIRDYVGVVDSAA